MTNSGVSTEPLRPPTTVGSFEVQMTDELLHHVERHWLRVQLSYQRERAKRIRRRIEPMPPLSVPTLRWAGPLLCLIGAMGSVFVVLMQYGEGDSAGTAIWILMTSLFLLFAVAFALFPQLKNRVDRLTARLDLWAEARTEQQMRRGIEMQLPRTPYTVRHELSGNRWTVCSEAIGERSIELLPTMTALHSDHVYALFKPGLFPRTLVVTAIPAAEDEARLVNFLRSNGVAVRDAEPVMARLVDE